MTEVNLKSSTIEKGLESAKNFLDKLIGPALEEVGLLLKDKIAFWRFRTQIKILNKAKDFCEKHNIQPKEISLKLLCPLLEYASLEDDELLQDKWAILLSNLVDSEQNIQNHVFPYILSQISINEFEAIENSYKERIEHKNEIQREIDLFDEARLIREAEIKKEIEELEKSEKSTPKVWHLKHELASLKYERNRLIKEQEAPEIVSEDKLQDFEIANLVRLGTIKSIQEHYAESEPITIEHPDYWNEKENNIKLDITIESEGNYHILTQLGELFISACSEKISIKE